MSNDITQTVKVSYGFGVDAFEIDSFLSKFIQAYDSSDPMLSIVDGEDPNDNPVETLKEMLQTHDWRLSYLYDNIDPAHEIQMTYNMDENTGVQVLVVYDVKLTHTIASPKEAQPATPIKTDEEYDGHLLEVIDVMGIDKSQLGWILYATVS